MEVTFKTVNGKFDGGLTEYTTVVTKLKEGVPAADGTAAIADGHVKAATADANYTGGIWTNGLQQPSALPWGRL